MAKTAFVTGGTGFLGHNLLLELVEAGWRVVALHRSTSNTSRLEGLPVERVIAELEDASSLEAAFPSGVDAVFHLASNTSVWARRDAEQTRTNVDGTRNLVRAALRKGAGRFVYTSSVAAFGLVHEMITEATFPCGDTSWINYHRTKRAAEVEVERGIEQGLDAIVLNPCHIMGPFDSHNWAQLFILTSKGKLPGVPPGAGTFCFSPEVARAHRVAAERTGLESRYILGGPYATFQEVVHRIGALLAKKVPHRPTPKWILDIGARLYGWQSAVTGREPDLTPEKVALVTRDERASSDRAIRDLGYRIVSLEEILGATHRWLSKENLLG